MYDHSSILICTVLFIAMLAALEAGTRIGRARQHGANESRKSQLSAVQGSLLGLLALLLGFTFSLALQRFDDRSRAVVDEANAIGTTLLRAETLDPAVRGEVTALLAEYVDLRARASSVTLADHDEREALLAAAVDMQAALWAQLGDVLAADDRTVTSGYYLQSLNEMIDSYGRRGAALDRHVPEPVLFLLFLTFLLVSLIVGITSGAANDRPPSAIMLMELLIVLLVFVIIDLDRPRRGLIEIDQSSITALQPVARTQQ